MMQTNCTFQIWIPRYLSSIKTKNYSAETIRAYGRTLRMFARYKAYLADHAGEHPADTSLLVSSGMTAEVDADPYEVSDFFTLICSERELKPASMQQYNSALSSFYEHLIAQNVVDTNPMNRVERPKIKDRELRYLRYKDVMKFIASLENPRDALLVRTIYATGMRVSELCSLRAEHINFDEQTIRVRGKGGKIRTVFCDPATLALIRRQLAGRTEGWVFPGSRGKALTTRMVEYVFERYAPPGITPHKIRHSYASELYKRSRNLRAVQENLGHNSIQTTEIYIHTDLDERRRAYQESFPLSMEVELGK